MLKPVRLTSIHGSNGYWRFMLRLLKYRSTEVEEPSSRSNIYDRAESREIFLTAWILFLGPYDVSTRKLVMNRWSCNRSRSVMLPNSTGLFFRRNSRQRPINRIGLYITPVEMSMLMYILFWDGRNDWKYPCHSSKPALISFFPVGVKKDLVLKGYFMLGSIRITTLNALEQKINSIHKSARAKDKPLGKLVQRCLGFADRLWNDAELYKTSLQIFLWQRRNNTLYWSLPLSTIWSHKP